MKNLTPKAKNIIVTAIVGLFVAVCSTICSINYVKHTNSEVQYVIREGMFTTEHLSKYSPNLEGSEGDTTIYKNFGTKNSVLLSKTNYQTLDEVKNLNLCIDNERFDYTGFENGAAMLLENVTSLTKFDTNDGASAVKNGEYDAFIVSYENAKELVKNDSSLLISDVEIELFPKILVLGGTHPYESSGFLTATLFLENVETERGIFYIIPEANKAGFNYETGSEARQQTFEVPLVDALGEPNGSRTFKIGSRYAHATLEWPLPDTYVHQSGAQMTNIEGTNLNRVYPGLEDGSFTEQVAYGIYQLVLQNNITLVVDLHEASPEYNPNEKVIYHNDVSEIWAAMSVFGYFDYVDSQGNDKTIYIDGDSSPRGSHGISHRELGDYTNAFVILCESNDVYEGKLHGPLTADLITNYSKNDKFYEYVASLSEAERNKYFDIWHTPVSIDVRVARHTASISAFINAYNDLGATQRTVYGDSFLDESLRHDPDGMNYTGKLIIGNIPSYPEIVDNSLGAYLLPIE